MYRIIVRVTFKLESMNITVTSRSLVYNDTKSAVAKHCLADEYTVQYSDNNAQSFLHLGNRSLKVSTL